MPPGCWRPCPSSSTWSSSPSASRGLLCSRARTLEQVATRPPTWHHLIRQNVADSASASTWPAQHRAPWARTGDGRHRPAGGRPRARPAERAIAGGCLRVTDETGRLRWGKGVTPKRRTATPTVPSSAHQAAPGHGGRRAGTGQRCLEHLGDSFTRSYRKTGRQPGRRHQRHRRAVYFHDQLSPLKLGPTARSSSADNLGLLRAIRRRRPGRTGRRQDGIERNSLPSLELRRQEGHFHTCQNAGPHRRTYAFRRIEACPTSWRSAGPGGLPWTSGTKSGATSSLFASAFSCSAWALPCCCTATGNATVRTPPPCSMEDRVSAPMSKPRPGHLRRRPEGDYLDVNPAGCALVGYSRDNC